MENALREYTVYFSDGTSYNSKTTTTIPSKGKIFMKIKAHEKQTIYVSVQVLEEG